MATDDASHGITRFAVRGSLCLALSGVSATVEHVDATRLRSVLRAVLTCRRRSDVVHLHVGKGYWGVGGRGLLNATVFQVLPRRLVVTVHDLHAGGDGGAGHDGREAPRVGVWARRGRRLKALGRRLTRADELARLLILWRADRIIVCSEGEAQRARRLTRRAVVVIPHVIEPLTPRHHSGLRPAGSPTTLVLVGWIHPRKGHALAVEALIRDPHTRLVFAGSCRSEHEVFLSQLLAMAERHGAASRLTVTGPLTDAEMTQVLRGADVALCPFERVAASGSLLTAVSAGLPVVASGTALTRWYAGRAPAAIKVFEPYTAESLLQAVEVVKTSTAADVRRDLNHLAGEDCPRVTGQRLRHALEGD